MYNHKMKHMLNSTTSIMGELDLGIDLDIGNKKNHP